jgi:hypothetical protein
MAAAAAAPASAAETGGRPQAEAGRQPVVAGETQRAAGVNGSSFAGDVGDAALRAAREDQELSARAAAAAAGAPNNIEGFKSHPLYMLERHIAKYQVNFVLMMTMECTVNFTVNYYPVKINREVQWEMKQVQGCLDALRQLTWQCMHCLLIVLNME